MANLSHLEVNNFRCFDHIEVDGLTNVNLFVGKNSAGKSTLLEAIAYAIRQMPFHFANSWREYKDKNMNDSRFAFYNLDVNKEIGLHASFCDNSNQTLRISVIKKDNLDVLIDNKTDEIKELKCEGTICKTSDDTPIPFSYLVKWEDDHRVAYNADKRILSELFHRDVCYLLSNTIEDDAMLDEYSTIVKRKEDDALLEVLQLFEDKVRKIRQIGNDICFDVEGVKEYLPSNFMGNGFRRYFNIVVTLMSKNSVYACFDEIENGLHYSNLSKLWNALIQFSVRNNIQLFLTTHSLETMESLKNVLEDEEMAEYREKVKVFKVAKTEKKGYQTYGYGFNEFQTALNSLIEMR